MARPLDGVERFLRCKGLLPLDACNLQAIRGTMRKVNFASELEECVGAGETSGCRNETEDLQLLQKRTLGGLDQSVLLHLSPKRRAMKMERFRGFDFISVVLTERLDDGLTLQIVKGCLWE
jgi:hypothetical protein